MSRTTQELKSVREIIFYGPEDCRGCTAGIKYLADNGIKAIKVVIDSDSPIVNELRVGNQPFEAPIVHADGVLIYTGSYKYKLMQLMKAEQWLLFEAGLIATPPESLLSPAVG